MSRSFVSAVLALVLLGPSSASAGWRDLLGPLKSVVSGQKSSEGEAGLEQLEVVDALKQALQLGTERAIEGLGREGGFLDDAQVRIPLPESLATLETGLRTFGQEQLAEQFRSTLNRAAERALPRTAKIFSDVIGGMSLEDAMALLSGADDAATQYLRENAGLALSDAVLPIVKDATAEAGVTAAYKALVGRSQSFLPQALRQESVDIDRYVTDKALDGLFIKLAQEEKKIRDDPAARTTELLGRVFGSAEDG